MTVSGRLRRPWPDLPAMQFPAYAPALTAVAVAGSFLPGLVGISGGVLAASLLMAYAHPRLCRAARDHARHRRPRLSCSAALYVTVLVFGWPVLVMSLARPRRHRLRLSRPRRAGSAAPSHRILTTLKPLRRTTMEVILLERVAKLGQMGEVVRVKDGFARNFLLPQGKALRATEANKAKFEGMKVELRGQATSSQGRGRQGRREARRQDLPGASVRRPKPASSTARCRRATSPTLLDRGRLRGRPQPDRAQRADQDHRPAQGADRAASGGRGHGHDQRRAQRRRGRAAGARRGRHGPPRGRRRRGRSRGREGRGGSVLRAGRGRSQATATKTPPRTRPRRRKRPLAQSKISNSFGGGRAAGGGGGGAASGDGGGGAMAAVGC